ncbi:MAG: hypothetical protein GY822_15505 [Deltaproteobacteria bacterium]|nr:hypothetical protein [Deltaproteobacteria bacterium]
MNSEKQATLSSQLLRNQPVPEALIAAWDDSDQEDKSVLIPFGEVEFVSTLDDEFFAGYTECGGDKAMAAAFSHMFKQIAFFGREADGALLGYWLKEEGALVKDAPVVELSNEGSWYLTPNLQDHFILKAQMEGEESDVVTVKSFFKTKGLATRSPDEIEAWADEQESPEETFDTFLEELTR